MGTAVETQNNLPQHKFVTSWDDLHQRQVAEPAIAADDAAIDFTIVFGSVAGQRVLEALKKQTVERPGLGPGFMDGQAMNNQLLLREGENNLYRWILSQIRRGEAAQQMLNAVKQEGSTGES